jgi:UDP-3-O-[3-hydroxymyristoyl] N-acetylglucosamine deacetylase
MLAVGIKSSPSLCQGTVATPLRLSGPGLHRGKQNKVEILPADPNSGIIFSRVESRGRETVIPAHWKNIRPLPLCTCLAHGKKNIRTVEHLMAAFYACGVDNAVVRVWGDEIPLLDGSAEPFVRAIRSAGVLRSAQLRRQFVVSKVLHVTNGGSWATLRPARRFLVDVVGGLGGFPAQRWRGRMDRRTFRAQICPARTYGHFARGLQAKILTFLLPNPLCLGANVNNAVVVHRGKILTPGGLRFPDEFVRHRVLDLMGDLMLAGGDIIGRLTCRRPTHELNRRLLEKLLSGNATP